MQFRPGQSGTSGVRRGEQLIEHLLRRAGFGASQEEIDDYSDLGYTAAVDRLVNYESIPDNVDTLIGSPGYVLVTAAGRPFVPAENITDSRQRWLFRMVHSRRPLQEKMALFWHNHFATGFTKIQGNTATTQEAVRYMAAKPSEFSGVKGQLELFRDYALGNFRDLLEAVAKDVAMLYWLDGRTNIKGRPQENFARELMELFTMGVDTFAEDDVYAGARVFSGWNLQRVGDTYNRFFYNGAQHDTTAKTFTFAIYPDGGKTIAARAESAGQQDGVDLLTAVARHPATGPRLARKLYAYFVSEVGAPDQSLINEMAAIYYASNFEIRPVLRHLLLSPQFTDPANRFTRYSWPAEFVVRSLKEVGWSGFSVNDALTPMLNMGQQLFEPPDVSGWDLGTGWFSSGGMLARMNFAAQLALNQKFNLRDTSRSARSTPETLVSFVMDRLTPSPLSSDAFGALADYVRAGGTWTGSDTQLATKASGLAHLIVGSGDYQLV
jgi:uncharacterized protein (DUF1800 family)